jgi:hypothetical protein
MGLVLQKSDVLQYTYREHWNGHNHNIGNIMMI